MEIKVQIKNLGAVKRAMAMAPRLMTHNLNEAIKSSRDAVFEESKRLVISGDGYPKAPFQTGKLWRTMFRTPVVNLRAEIYPQVDYAIYVHEGLSTSRTYGRRPFLEDAIEDRQELINEHFGRAVENTLNQVATQANRGF